MREQPNSIYQYAVASLNWVIMTNKGIDKLLLPKHSDSRINREIIDYFHFE